MLELKNISKTYKGKKGVVTKALDNVSLTLPDKGLVFILGRSGCGKSTLLNIMGGLDKADSGKISIMGRSFGDFSAADFDSYRNTFVGFVFQEFNVLNEFSVEDNISVALELQGKKPKREDIDKILKQFDLETMAKRKPNTLSGGQKQRVAIARALIKDPKIVLADEPTGSLDSETGREVLDALKMLSEDKLVVIVSHDREFAREYADRIIEMSDGRVIADRTSSYISDAGGEKRQYSDTEKKLIRSRLPARRAFKMGMSGFKVKPIRLIFTVLLTFIAFTVFGVFSTLALYDEIAVMEQSILSTDPDTLDLRKTFSYYSYSPEYPDADPYYLQARVPLSESEFAAVAAAYPGALAAAESTARVTGYTAPDNYFYFTEYSGVMFGANDSAAGIELVAGAMPASVDEALISDYTFMSMQYTERMLPEEDRELKSYEDFDLIPVQEVYGAKLKIVGVYKTAPLNESSAELKAAVDSGTTPSTEAYYAWQDQMEEGVFDYLFVRADFVRNNPLFKMYYINDGFGIQNVYDHFLSPETDISVTAEYVSEQTISYVNKYNYDNYLPLLPVFGFDLTDPITELAPDEAALSSRTYGYVIVSYLHAKQENILERMQEVEPESDLGALSTKYNGIYRRIADNYQSDEVTEQIAAWRELNDFMTEYGLEYPRVSLGYGGEEQTEYVKVAGIVMMAVNYPVAYLGTELYDELYRPSPSYNLMYRSDYRLPEFSYISSVFIDENAYADSTKALNDILAEVPDDGSRMVLGNSIAEEVSRVTYGVTSFYNVALYAWIGFMVFAILLMFLFISASIAAKKRDIGILRALGARSADVFVVFWLEALVMAAACLILSIVGAAVICVVLNNAILGALHYSVTALLFTPVNALLMAAAAAVTATAATVLPVIIYAKKAPVESIRSI